MMQEAIDDTIFRLRIITGALVSGVTTCGAIAYFLVRRDGFLVDSSLEVPLIGALAALITGLLLAYPVVQKSVKKKTTSDGRLEADLLASYSVLVVIRSAMIESIGLFGGVIYLMTAHGMGLLAIACSIALLLAKLPSRQGAEDFMSGVG